MDDYTENEIRKIARWKAEEPGVASRVVGFALKPVTWLFNRVVPQSALEAMLNGARLAHRVCHTRLVRLAARCRLPNSRYGSCNGSKLGNRRRRWEGAAAGWFGILSAPIDIPAVIMLWLRTVRRIGLCYGYCGSERVEREFVLGVLGSAGANSMAEKMVSLHTLSSVQRMVATQTFKSMAERAAEATIGKEAAIIAMRDLAKQIGVNLTKRKMLAAIPAIGAAVGASLNGWYLRDVGIAAQRAYQERWLLDQGIVSEVKPDPDAV
jgi:hypothetical protein